MGLSKKEKKPDQKDTIPLSQREVHSERSSADSMCPRRMKTIEILVFPFKSMDFAGLLHDKSGQFI